MGFVDGDFNPIGVARNCIKNAFNPILKAISNYNSEADQSKESFLSKQNYDDDLVKSIQKNFDDIEILYLRNTSSNEVPQVKLVLDEEVEQLIKENPKANISDLPPNLAHDSSFFNKLQESLTKWAKLATILIKHSDETVFESFEGEIQYWKIYEKSLKDLAAQFQEQGVKLTIDILKTKKKFSKIQDLAEDLKLNEKIEKTNSISVILQQIDLNSFENAETIDEVHDAMISTFQHIKSLFANINYPAEKFEKLLKNFSALITDKLIQIYKKMKVMEIDFIKFEELQNILKTKIISVWSNQVSFVKESNQNSGYETSTTYSFVLHMKHTKFQDRVKELFSYREAHENLIKIIQEIYQKQDNLQEKISNMNFISEEKIQETFQKFINSVDLYDLSKQGQKKLIEAKEIYDIEIDGYEKEIIMKIRDLLGSTKNFNEMFKVFTRFSGLMKRSQIKSAIREYQEQLLKKIYDKTNSLKEKFMKSFENSGSVKIAQYYNMYNISGYNMWSHFINYHMEQNIKDIELIFGENLQSSSKGKDIRAYYDNFKKMRQKEQQKHELDQQQIEVTGALLNLEHIHRNDTLRLTVNFTPQMEKKIVELRNMIKKKDQVKSNLSKKYYFKKNAWPVYVNALRLIETVKIWNYVTPKIDDSMANLLSNQLETVYVQIEKGFKYEWNGKDQGENEYNKFFFDFYQAVQDLEDATEYLYEKKTQIDESIKQINSVDINYEQFFEIVKNIQEIIDELLLKQFTNIESLVNQVNEKIEKQFTKRLTELLQTWIEEFTKYTHHKRTRRKNKIIQDFIKHEILVKNKIVYIDPPIQQARVYWLNILHSKIHIFTCQKKLKVNRYNITFENEVVNQSDDFSLLIQKLPENLLAESYQCITNSINKAEKYVKEWLSYQALYNIDVGVFRQRFGDNMETWQIVLNEIKQGRNTFDNQNFERNYGPVVINYKNVQLKIQNLYDSLHKDILNEFADKFIQGTRNTIQEVRQQLDVLEKINFQDTQNLVQNISAINYCKSNIQKWEDDIQRAKDNEKLLLQQKYHFKEDYKNAESLDKEFKRFKHIYQYKSNLFQNNTENIKHAVNNEEELLLSKLGGIENLWKEKKPFGADLKPNEALEVLDQLESTILENKEKLERINKAKELLKLEPIDLTTMMVIIEDSELLKEIWQTVKKIWVPFEDIMEMPFQVLQPMKFLKVTDQILQQIQALDPKFKNHDIFIGKKKEIQDSRKKFKMIRDLKSEAIKEHHLKEIHHIIKLDKDINDVVLGDYFNINLLAYEKQINDIVSHATGELVLENMIVKIKTYWHEVEFETSNYQQKVQLIKGWDEIMERAEEDLSQLGSMKLSQHYKTFEAEIKSWNDKVLKISNCLNVWMDVQRKWVYLEGIFLGSSDIKQQLANEYDRFQKVNHEFMNIMKQMYSKLKVLDVITSIPQLYKTLEFLSETLDKIQKSLSDYLEKQRQKFSRFYFIGDEDLLEIIGNSKQIANIQKYFSKMFAGVNRVLLDEDAEEDILVGMASKEDERVQFDEQIQLSQYEKIHHWLLKFEEQMQTSLASLLELALESWKQSGPEQLRELVEKYPTQIIIVSFQVYWTWYIEEQIMKQNSLSDFQNQIVNFLSFMAEEVLKNLPTLSRLRYQQLITEMVHKRDVTRKIDKIDGIQVKDFAWQYYQRYNLNFSENVKKNRLRVNVGNSWFYYSYEYLGITEKLVQTPLTDKCYFTLCQALWLRMGGAPFGPAGTGKTESVKMLGASLGRFVLVFNCDENFNFKAMGRIFIGLCQVGAWGCFDEFNRLEERILSAVSQQILTIQSGMRQDEEKIDLMNKQVFLNKNMGIFVTMNPGYAGRSNLPENLKQLFRQMAMIKPDSVLIAQVMLFSQGFKSAEELSGKVVALFELCSDQLSSQPHYDFGLRALKSVLNSAGNLKRKILSEGEIEDPHSLNQEQKIILRSFCDTVVPKLISEDGPLLKSLIQGVFPSSQIPPIEDKELMEKFPVQFEDRFLLLSNEKFMQKVLQLSQILKLHHGVMLVGPTGCGKSAAWNTLLSTLTEVDKIKGEKYIIDPKAITKDELYGKLDNTTMEWTDGIFTHILRKIVENQRGESAKRHWIVFDGDVDPEWAENLNSVLDDNKLLTLPNGERLSIPPNVKILFEVESLKWATLATVSRCGMVWFSEDIIENEHIYYHYLERIKQENYDSLIKIQTQSSSNDYDKLRQECVEYMKPMFYNRDGSKSYVTQALEIAEEENHVMQFSRIRVLEALFALLRKGVEKVIEKDENSFGNYSQKKDIIKKFMLNFTLFALNWSFCGDIKLSERSEYFKKLQMYIQNIPEDLIYPETDDYITLIDYQVQIETGEFSLWKNQVPVLDIQPEQVTNASLIITTVDTLRHQEVLCSWLLEHRPFIICGPPGSGKTMTLMSTLNSLQDFEMIFVNFSSSTTPQLILKQFEHYCEYAKGAGSYILRPRMPNKWLVLFCDEINLPDEDKYGTQYVITFLRQLTEQHGFWRAHDKQWVKLERIQFVGACNPPTDAGRHPLAQRFMRHTPLILVDFPGYDSLVQIYGTFNRGMLKRTPSLKPYADSLTSAMVEYYSQSQRRFTSDQQPHYIYSPRELTRWKYALNQALDNVNSLEDLVRLWAHEALRLFEDRLVTPEEKKWCQQKVDELAMQFFPGIDMGCLERPIYFTSFLSNGYKSVQKEDLRKEILEKLKVFNEEEYDVQLVVFDEVLEHIMKIDRVLKQPIGHMLLVGASGVGKTTLSRFVSWMNGLKVFQIKAGRNYSILNFDEDLRQVMKRAGCHREKITFIFDESNVLSVAFLERMNALLASGEVPGLFEGEEYVSLINTYKEAQGGKVNENDEEIYEIFTKNVQKNLHVVFTMNPANPDFTNRTASSPAIFNRCVIDWFGDWPESALYAVSKELTADTNYKVDHNVIVDTIVKIHNSVITLNQKLRSSAQKFNYITPRDYLDFIRQYLSLRTEKNDNLNETQSHLKEGLASLKETEENVNELKKELDIFNVELESQNNAAEQKLELILEGKKESNEKIQSSKELQEKIAIKKEEIAKESKVVNKQLAEAGPSLEAAKKALSNIKASDIKEIVGYQKPPKLVFFVMKPTIYLYCSQPKMKMKNKKILELIEDWKECKKIMSQPKFITDIIDLNVDDIPAKVLKKIEVDYVKAKEGGKDLWNLEKIKNASKVAGPLAQFIESQITYKDILNNVDPLREKIQELDKENKELEEKQTELTTNIKELEVKIKEYQTDYEQQISKIEELKIQKETTLSKITKAENLLMGLSSEKSRWSTSFSDFGSQFDTLTGDVLIASAFLTYLGFFGQQHRFVLFNTWKKYLTTAKIPFKKELSIVEFLSMPSERILWQRKGLSADDLNIQNAIILKRFNRYPLIIDPSGQAMDFMINLYSDQKKKLVRTSFIDDGFMKQLDTSLRFGLPIMIQDVEKIEPILNSVLNKEIVKQSGRVLIRVGDQEIDFSHEFKLFMITRNADANFTPDLCSRVTFVNFTVTHSSLESQFTNMYLKNERPDVEQKRLNLLKLQGEFIVKLRQLEDDLLYEISNSQGKQILENDEMIQKLENIKKESAYIEEEMSKSDVVWDEINEVTSQYKALAQISSRLFFVLQKTGIVNYMYQYSLKFYLKIFSKLLKENEKLNAIPSNCHDERIIAIENEIFLRVFEKIDTSIMERHKILFSLRFAQVKLEQVYGQNLANLFKIMFTPSKLIETTLPESLLKGLLNQNQLIELENLSNVQGFNGLVNSLRKNEDQWLELIRNPQQNRIEFWDFVNFDDLNVDYEKNEQMIKDIIEIVILKIVKPQSALILINNLIDEILGKDFLKQNNFNLKKSVQEDADNKSPILFVSAPGFDPSNYIYDLAKRLNIKFEDVAIGSAEGYDIAQKAIDQASKEGFWVILRNVHLAPSWLKDQEQNLYKMNPNPNFRIFLLAEFSEKLPVTLIRQSVKFIFELPDGVKASVKRTYDNVYDSDRSNKNPPERCRLHFLLAWTHAVIMERLRYTPTGWSKKYEFSEADQKCALDIIDEYIDLQGQRQNLPLEQIPFEALRSIISNNIYGGKIDNAFDLKILKSIVDQYINEDSFDPSKVLVQDKNYNIQNPDGVTHNDFKEWITNLEQIESPLWAGLPSSADDILKSQKLKKILINLSLIQESNVEEIADLDSKKVSGQNAKGQFLDEVAERTTVFLDILPGQLDKLERDEKLIGNPLFRFLDREITVSSKLLVIVRKELKDVLDMAEGNTLPLQNTKKLADEIIANTIPKFWRKYVVPDQIGFTGWIKDFKDRITQLQPLPNTQDWQQKGINLGEFLFPEAFITATRQYVATNLKLSMDELELKITKTNEKKVDEQSFLVKNMWIQGVKWSDNGFEFADEMTHHLTNIKFTWQPVEHQSNPDQDKNLIYVPLYLNKTRQNLILSVKFKIDSSKISKKALYQRGIAFLAWNN